MKESQNWYVRRGKEVKGPFPAGLVSRYLLLGRIAQHDEVSRGGGEWQPIHAVKELVPDVLRNALANPDDEEAQRHLESARRWADERTQTKGAPPQGAERRTAEGLEEEALRAVHQARGDELASEPVRRRDYLIVAATLLLLVAVPLLLPSRSKPNEPQCDAAPAPQVNWNNCRLETKQYPNSNLAGARMRNTDLAGAVLRASNLAGADVAYANLTLTNLRGANLQGASLKGATLHKADLVNANLTGADLSYADLTGAALDGAVLAGANLEHAVWAEGVVCMPGSVGECKLARPAQ